MSESTQDSNPNKDRLQNATTYFPVISWSDPNLRAELSKYGVVVACFVISAAVLYVAATDPKSNTNQFYLYSVFGILPVLIGLAIVSPLFSEKLSIASARFYGFIALVFVFCIYYFYQGLNPQSVSIYSRGLSTLLLLGLFVGLAILYRIFVRTINNMRGWIGFVFQVLFFIPCLLIDALEYLFTMLRTAPAMISFLFILEILVLIAYFYASKWIGYLYTSPSNQIMNQPMYLNVPSTIAHNDTFIVDGSNALNPTGSTDPSGNPIYNQNYTISFWSYVNPMTTSNAAYTKEQNILTYGIPYYKTGKPRITYFNDPAATNAQSQDNYTLYLTDHSNSPTYKWKMGGQKWNNVVVTYTDGSVELYVNGQLETRMPVGTPPTYAPGDVMTIGDGDGTGSPSGTGLFGAICNVSYYPIPLVPMQITTAYNILQYKNPPIN